MPLVNLAAVPHLHLLCAVKRAGLEELDVMPGAAAGERNSGDRDHSESSESKWHYAHVLQCRAA